MCGLAGYLALWGDRDRAPLGRIAGAMARELVHRGPDDEGIWVDEAAGAALSHRRLSVVDLSPEGHQPMTSRSGRFVLVFNGEIYNYKSLRTELKCAGESFRGTSDMEVMLAGFERWGYETTLGALNGMFAIALWDRSERRLHLARDRMGEKPLYYGVAHGAFAFASELKALRALGWALETVAVAEYMRYGYVPAASHAGSTSTSPAPETGSTICGGRSCSWLGTRRAAPGRQSSAARPLRRAQRDESSASRYSPSSSVQIRCCAKFLTPQEREAYRIQLMEWLQRYDYEKVDLGCS